MVVVVVVVVVVVAVVEATDVSVEVPADGSAPMAEPLSKEDIKTWVANLAKQSFSPMTKFLIFAPRKVGFHSLEKNACKTISERLKGKVLMKCLLLSLSL